MGAKYKIKKGSGCKMCKPHKGGWTPKHKKKFELHTASLKQSIYEHEIGALCTDGTYSIIPPCYPGQNTPQDK